MSNLHTIGMSKLGLEADQGETFTMFLCPGFSMYAFSSALDTMRHANVVAGRCFYRWRTVSISGDAVTSASGVRIDVDGSLKEEKGCLTFGPRCTRVLIFGPETRNAENDREIRAWLLECRRRGLEIGAVGSGVEMLASAGLLDGKKCTLHWLDVPAFEEKFGDRVTVTRSIFEMDSRLFTCAGGGSTVDMMLTIVGRDLGADVLQKVCELGVIDRVRITDERQRMPLITKLGSTNQYLINVIQFMEDNISQPLRLDKLAQRIGLSRRQIERLFKSETGQSPARYYSALRLERARELLRRTNMPIVDVAVACGFVSASESGGAKLDHGSGGIVPLRAA